MKDFYVYLESLKDLFDSKSCLLIGGGVEVLQKTSEIFEKIYVVEADEKRYEQLKATFENSKINFFNELVYKDKKVKFFVMNNSSANSVNEKNFKNVFPNLYVKESRDINAVSLGGLIKKCDINPQALFVNSLNSLEILKSNDFKKYDIIACKVLADELDEINNLFEKNNFKLLKTFEKSNPKILLAVFAKDFQKIILLREKELIKKYTEECNAKDKIIQEILSKNENLHIKTEQNKKTIENLLKEKELQKKLLEDKENQILSLKNILEKNKKEFETQKKELKSLQLNFEDCMKEKNELLQFKDLLLQLQSNFKKENMKLIQTIHNDFNEILELKTEIKKYNENEKILQEKISNIESQFIKQEGINDKFDFLIKGYNEIINFINVKSENISSEIENSKKDIKNFINQKSTITAKQVESFINIINYFEKGILPLNFHGWPISSDLAVFIINKLQENNYQFTLEFGSGTSTILFAEIMKKRNIKKSHIAFEHNKEFYEKTLHQLKIRGLDEYTILNFSPLKEIELNSVVYKYYDCESIFDNLSEKFNKKGNKTLILVDGPPGNTNKYARFPAIYYIMKYLNNMTIHLILDDYNRTEEKEIVKMWKEELKKNNFSFKETILATEKGLYFLEIEKGV